MCVSVMCMCVSMHECMCCRCKYVWIVCMCLTFVCRWCGGSLNVELHVSVHLGNPQQIQHAQQLIKQKCDMMVSQ